MPKTEIEATAMEFEDLRNYKVENNKILATGWRALYSLESGIKQIKDVIKENRITDIKNPIYSNEAYLKDNAY